MKHLKVKCLSVFVDGNTKEEVAQLSILVGAGEGEPEVIGLAESDETKHGKYEVGQEYDLALTEEQWEEIVASAATVEKTEAKDLEGVEGDAGTDEAKEEVEEVAEAAEKSSTEFEE